MESMEAKVNEKEIEKDLLAGLKNAEMESQNSPSEIINPVPVKLSVSVPNIVVRFLCDFKNRIEAKIISKDMDEDTKEFVREYLKTTPEEIKLYKGILDVGATELTPEEYKAFLNKWLCNPVIMSIELVIEHECQRLIQLRNLLRNRKKEVS